MITLSYENATKLLATHCAICARPLLDAISVELGIGPDCRKKYMGKAIGATEAARIEANQLVYKLALQISVNQHGIVPTEALQAGYAIGGRKAIGEMLMADTEGASMLARIRELGFEKLADKLVSAHILVTITAVGTSLSVAAPYNEDATGAWRAIPGRKWNPNTKTNDIPATQGQALYALLRRYYAGKAAIGPKGPFMIPAEAPAPSEYRAAL